MWLLHVRKPVGARPKHLRGDYLYQGKTQLEVAAAECAKKLAEVSSLTNQCRVYTEKMQQAFRIGRWKWCQYHGQLQERPTSEETS